MQNVPLRWISAAAALVLIILPRPDGVASLILEQALLIVLAVAATGQAGRIRLRYGLRDRGPVALIAICVILAQQVLGVAVHEGRLDVLAHAGGAAIVAALTIWVCAQMLFRDFQVVELRRTALALLSLTFSQLLLGMGALMNRAGAATPQLEGRLTWFSTAHAVCASLLLAGHVVAAALLYSRLRPEDAELAHGGVAIA